MLKAFLSHSSKDKNFVDLVAKILDRDSAIYDTWSFDTGIEFAKSIDDGLDDSAIFVLFASPNALNSDWINYESDEAHARHLAGKIVRPLVFLLSDKVTVDDLPEWLKKGRIVREGSSKLIARMIRRHLDDVTRSQQRVGFVGRGVELDAAKLLIRPVGDESKRIALIYGIRGIGKRSFAARLFSDVYNFNDTVEIRVEDADLFGDVVAKLADVAGAYAGHAGLSKLLQTINKSSREKQESYARDYLSAINRNGIVTLFVDDGGLVDNDGRLSRTASELLELFAPDRTLKAALITFRRSPSLLEDAKSIPQIQVGPLSKVESMQLLSSFAELWNVALTKSELERAADWVKGHPWSARYAIELIRAYGFAHVAETAQLISLREAVFLGELDEHGDITANQRYIMRVLSEYSPLPPTVLIQQSDLSPRDWHESAGILIDRTFIIVEANGDYKLADPISDAVLKRYGRVPIDHGRLLAATRAYLPRLEDDERRLNLERVAWSAAMASNNLKIALEYNHLASDAVHAARNAFYRRDFEESLRLGRYALSIRDDDVLARSFVARSHARLGHYDEALDEVQQLRTRSALREAYYITGYIEQLRRRHREAARAFKSAIDQGRRDGTIYRELAESLYYMEEYVEAKHYAELARNQDDNSRFVLDLLVRIYLKLNDLPLAELRLRQLRLADPSAYFNHRRSVLEYAKGEFEDAVADARVAYNNFHSAPEVIGQYVRCLIKVRALDDAKVALRRLEKMSTPGHDDVATGLRVQLQSAEEKFEDALVTWDRIKDKDKPVNLAIRCEALSGYIRQLEVTDPLRAEMQQQLNAINLKLSEERLDTLVASSAL